MTKFRKLLPRRSKNLFIAVARSFDQFIRSQISSGIILIAVTLIALVWANSQWSDSYRTFWETEIGVRGGGFELIKSLRHWINDGLMAIFFLSIGLEIKHEVLSGKLSSLKQAALPIAGALGGMIVPALIYAYFNNGSPEAKGWGIPVATDIAFSLGILALLGSRIPSGVRTFVAALAIADDLGAVLIIAIFYSSNISAIPLFVAAVLIGVLYLLNRIKVASLFWYLALGFVVWLAMLGSGIHATIAGVLVGIVIPHESRWTGRDFLGKLERVTERMRVAIWGKGDPKSANEEVMSAIRSIEVAAEQLRSPLDRLSGILNGPVAYFIVPIFAMANAGVLINLNTFGTSIREHLFLGIAVGLIIGKPVGIYLFSRLAVWMRVATLPTGVNWKHLFGASALCGIGFTMSLFIGELALGASPEIFETAKLSILVASIAAGFIGYFYLRTSHARP